MFEAYVYVKARNGDFSHLARSGDEPKTLCGREIKYRHHVETPTTTADICSVCIDTTGGLREIKWRNKQHQLEQDALARALERTE